MAKISSPPRAATLAVGTEITDGQIVDSNSAWISSRLVAAGVAVVEHRAVADERGDIETALRDLGSRVDILFVTGGLGPTSDDFTRDLIAKVFQSPLEFDENSWNHVNQALASRGVPVREIQRQQCYFPKGAQVLSNPAGTANAFCLSSSILGQPLKLYALPGPPGEIAAVWQTHISNFVEGLLPPEFREELAIIRCLGRGESQVAEVVEEVIQGTGLKVGYRAHMPYVEVKLWFTAHLKNLAQAKITEIENRLRPWVVNRDNEDVADPLIDWLRDSIAAGRPSSVRILDSATGGLLHERLNQRLRVRQLTGLPICMETHFSLKAPALSSVAGDLDVHLSLDESENLWRIRVLSTGREELMIEEKPNFNYKVTHERARKYITERLFLSLASVVGPLKK